MFLSQNLKYSLVGRLWVVSCYRDLFGLEGIAVLLAVDERNTDLVWRAGECRVDIIRICRSCQNYRQESQNIFLVPTLNILDVNVADVDLPVLRELLESGCGECEEEYDPTRHIRLESRAPDSTKQKTDQQEPVSRQDRALPVAGTAWPG